jgi:hypothetical protein
MNKFYCLFYYVLGEICLKINFFNYYQTFMLKSANISEKYDLKIWKEINLEEIEKNR